MATIKSEIQTASALTVTGFNSLASANYCVSNTITHTTNDPLDVMVEVLVTPSTTTVGNKQLVVFAKASTDGTNFSSGPESGTTTTDEPDLYFVGTVPANTTTAHRRTFSLAAAYGGILPAASKIILKNDMGVALAATGNSVQTAEVWGVAV